MKKLQYLSALVLLIGLGDITGQYIDALQMVAFLISSFVWIDDLESKPTLYSHTLILLLVIFNPFYHPWLEIDSIRMLLYVATSVFFLLKTSEYGGHVSTNTKKHLKESF